MHKPFVVVIEDNEGINKLLEHKFKRMNYNVQAFENGKYAYDYIVSESIKGNIPDIIILDIMLYGMTGWEILQSLSVDERFKAIPVVALTVRNRMEDIQRLMNYDNIEEYVKKPFKLTELTLLVDRLIKRDPSNLTQESFK